MLIRIESRPSPGSYEAEEKSPEVNFNKLYLQKKKKIFFIMICLDFEVGIIGRQSEDQYSAADRLVKSLTSGDQQLGFT